MLTMPTGPLDSTSLTPKQATVGGVKFFRSKNGNLYRSGIVNAKKWENNLGTCRRSANTSRNNATIQKRNEPCKRFTLTGIIESKCIPTLSHLHISDRLDVCRNFNVHLGSLTDIITCTGRCSKGPRCPFLHNPAQVAMCKTYLQTGTCPSGDACDLSHEPTPERVPACLHFLRGNCSNPSCRYAHVRVNPLAPVCIDFAAMGFCRKGAECPSRHVHECPDYANNGVCRNTRCHLPHIDRAGQIKKRAAANAARPTSSSADEDDEDSDLVSENDNDDDEDDLDSDGIEEIMDLDDDDATSHAISEQRDYVSF